LSENKNWSTHGWRTHELVEVERTMFSVMYNVNEQFVILVGASGDVRRRKQTIVFVLSHDTSPLEENPVHIYRGLGVLQVNELC